MVERLWHLLTHDLHGIAALFSFAAASGIWLHWFFSTSRIEKLLRSESQKSELHSSTAFACFGILLSGMAAPVYTNVPMGDGLELLAYLTMLAMVCGGAFGAICYALWVFGHYGARAYRKSRTKLI